MSPSQTRRVFRVVDAPISRCAAEFVAAAPYPFLLFGVACPGQRTAATEEPPVYLFTFDDVGMVFQRWGTKTAHVATDAW